MGNFLIPVIYPLNSASLSPTWKITNRDKLETHLQINFANCEVDTYVIYLFDVYSAYVCIYIYIFKYICIYIYVYSIYKTYIPIETNQT